MKKFFALAFALLGLVVATSAQNTNSVVTKPATTTTLLEPEWPGQVVLLADGKLVPLENQRPQTSTKVKGLGFGGGTMAFVYQGTTSPTRVKTAEFLVRLAAGENPNTVILGLSPMVKEKGNRLLVAQKVGGLIRGFKTSTGSDGLEVRFEKYGTTSAKIVPTTPLAPGEYAFRTASGVTYLFGVE